MKVLVRILVSAAALGVLLAVLPLGDLWSALRRLPLPVWLGVVAGFGAGHALGVLKWTTMLRVGRASLRPRDGVRCYSAGLFANLCLPSIVGGDVLRAILAGRATGRPEAVVVGSIGDRLCDMLSLALLAGVGALLAGAALSGWGPNVIAVLAVVGLVGGGLFVPLAVRRPLDAWPARFRRVIGRGLVALRRLARAPGAALTVVGLSFTIQTGFVLLNAWLGRSVGIDVPLAVWFFAWPVAKVAGLLPVSLGGLGVRDATLGALLLPFGVPMASGVAVSLLWQTVLVAGGLLAGSAWLVLTRVSAEPVRSPFGILRQTGAPGGV